MVAEAQVADPAAEPTADGGEVVAVRLAIGSAERRDQVGVGTDEAVPDVEDRLGLRRQDLTGPAQRRGVRVASQQGCLELGEVLLGDGRRSQTGVVVGVAGNGIGHVHFSFWGG